MKKRLEADLISIAHRILQLKNKSDINLLYLETQKLYEKLAVLRFIDTHYGDVKPTIGYAEIEKEVESFFDKEAKLPVETVIEMKETFTAVKNTTEEKTQEETAITTAEELTTPKIVSPEIKEEEEENTASEAIEEEEDEFTEEESVEDEFTETEEIEQEQEPVKEEIAKPSFKAAFELSEEVEIEAPKKTEAVQISFDDLLGADYTEPLFVKVDDITPAAEIVFEPIDKANLEEKVEEKIKEEEPAEEKPIEDEAPKAVSLNDKLSKGIEIDLNDRIAFVKHLFGNSNEDYNRVMSQLLTFDNFYETKSFIEEMVKPDYNNWEGKENYEERFMDIIEKKFL